MENFLSGDRFRKSVIDGDKGIYSQMDAHDIISRIPDLLNHGWKVNDRGMISPAIRGAAHQTPWIHVKHSPGKKCNLDSHILFEHWDIIPSRCQECWKTVIAPRTLKELFQLLELEKQINLPSKCGIEVREYTPRLYGGYVYSDSLEQGRERYKLFKEAVSDTISPDIPIILKRGCTEMELKKGPSVAWHVTDQNRQIEQYVERLFEIPERSDIYQADHIKAHIQRKWVKWAFAHGDKTYLEFTDGKPLYPDTIKYHEGDVSGIKRDLRRARMMLADVPEDTVERFDSDLSEILGVLDISEKQLAAGLGFNDISPLAIGEHDETT